MISVSSHSTRNRVLRSLYNVELNIYFAGPSNNSGSTYSELKLRGKYYKDTVKVE